MPSLTSLKGSKNVNFGKVDPVAKKWSFLLERERLLSRISANPTVGSLRDKKGSCSTQKGLRVGTEFMSF